MRILIIETAYPVNTRTQRLISSLKDVFGESSVKSVCWNRDNREIIQSEKSNYIYWGLAKYGNKISTLIGIRGFAKFVRDTIHLFAPDIIIASHWDALFIAALYKTKNTTLIYENLDMPTGNFLTISCIRLVERMSLNRVDCITFASRFYLPYYNFFNKGKFIIENKLPKMLCTELPHSKNTGRLVVTFLGGIRYFSILSNLVEAIGNVDGIELRFYGRGHDYEKLCKISKPYSNIIIYGPYQYSSIPEIYSETDIIWAAYPSNDFNVKLAISNKYHESLHFGVPAIFSKGTKLGEMVESSNAGYCVDCYSVEDIKRVIIEYRDNQEKYSKLFKDNLSKLKYNENKNWEEEISPFIEYIKILCKK